MIKTLLIIGVGGFAGSICRYLVQHYFVEHYPSDYPWGTFIANVTGCFLIGLIFGLILKGSVINQEVAFLLTAGFCGAFTTFSTFSYEGLLMINQGKILLFMGYTTLSVVLGLICTWAGVGFSKVFF